MAAILIDWPGQFDTPIMIVASLVKFGIVVSEEKIFEKLTTDDDDWRRRQVMKKAHLAFKRTNM